MQLIASLTSVNLPSGFDQIGGGERVSSKLDGCWLGELTIEQAY